MKATLVQVLCFVALAKATNHSDDIDLRAAEPDRYLPTYFMIPNLDPSSSRIAGGEEATPHSIPYQAAVLIPKTKGTSFCGGSLITKQTVLTAAHCVDGSVKPLTVFLGAHKIWKPESTKVTITTSKYYVHERWNKKAHRNDVAVVYFSSPVKLTNAIQLIKLADDPTQSYELSEGVVSGWGRSSDKSTKVSDVLRKVSLPIIANKVCNVAFLDHIRNTNICTSGLGGKSSCNSDCGGPLVIDNVQVGIASFGSGENCGVGWPSAFTRVSSYIDWINEHSI